jgi:hypothetical protein
MSRTRMFTWWAPVIGFFCLVLPSQGQVDTGTILGIVRDSSGAVVPGAKVTLSNEGTSFTETTTTSGSRNYVFTPLRIGSYTVEVEQPGFKKQRKTGQALNIQQQLVVDFRSDYHRRCDWRGPHSANRERLCGTGGGQPIRERPAAQRAQLHLSGASHGGRELGATEGQGVERQRLVRSQRNGTRTATAPGSRD